MPDKNIYLFLILTAFIALALFTRKTDRSWLSPVSFAMLFWTLLIGISLIAAPEYYYSAKSFLFILASLFVYFTGSLLTGHLTGVSTNKNMKLSEDIHIRNNIIISLFTTGIISGILSFVLLVTLKGFNLPDLLKTDSYIQIASKLSIDRYSGKSLPGIVMLLMTINYSIILVSGFINSKKTSNRIKILTLLNFFPSLALTIISTSRLIFLFSLIFFLSSYLAGKAGQINSNKTLFTKKFIISFLIACIIIPVLFLLTQIARMKASYNSFEDIIAVVQHLKIWFVGHVSCFSAWFDNTDFNDIQSLGLGTYTIGGIYEFLGLGVRKLGVFEERFYVNYPYEFSNIYTIFRILIEDFSIYGAFIVCFISGMTFKYIYQKTIFKNILYIPLLSLIYSIILCSIVGSIIYYNAVLVAYLMFYIIMFMIRKFTFFQKTVE